MKLDCTVPTLLLSSVRATTVFGSIHLRSLNLNSRPVRLRTSTTRQLPRPMVLTVTSMVENLATAANRGRLVVTVVVWTEHLLECDFWEPGAPRTTLTPFLLTSLIMPPLTLLMVRLIPMVVLGLELMWASTPLMTPELTLQWCSMDVAFLAV